MISFTAQIKDDDDYIIIHGLNPEYLDQVKWFISKMQKYNGYCKVTLNKPFKARSTGEDSQNHHLNGHIAQICNETGNDFDTVKLYIKQKAIEKEYPFKTFRGVPIAKSESKASVDECAILIEVAHWLASEYGIRLIENNK